MMSAPPPNFPLGGGAFCKIARAKIAQVDAAQTRSGAMPQRFDPEYWRERAEEARAQAEEMHDAKAKRTLLGIAESYDKLAEQGKRCSQAT